MPSQPGVKIVRKRLADGTVKEYRYSRSAPRPRLSPYAPGTVGGTIIAYKRSLEWEALAPATRQNYTIYLHPIERLAHLRLADVKRAHLYALRDALAKARGKGAATGFVRAVQALLTWALRRGLIEHSPAHRLETPQGGHLVAWSLAQARAALKLLPPHLARVVLLGMHTGQRRGDLCRLAWTQYDGAAIRLVQQKTGRALVIPVGAELRAALDGWRREATATTILTDASGRPWKPGYLSEALPAAMERAGLPPLGVHGLRKLAAAMLADAGCSTHEVAAITGHETLSMVQLYTKSADQQRLASAAVHRLETGGRGNRGKQRARG